jgi:hypothetical protein
MSIVREIAVRSPVTSPAAEVVQLSPLSPELLPQSLSSAGQRSIGNGLGERVRVRGQTLARKQPESCTTAARERRLNIFGLQPHE